MPRQRYQGTVVSDRQNKTVVVSVVRTYQHKKYGKTMRSSKNYHAHDEENAYCVGDHVEIEECKPLSKLKRFLVTGSGRPERGGGSNRNPGFDKLETGFQSGLTKFLDTALSADKKFQVFDVALGDKIRVLLHNMNLRDINTYIELALLNLDHGDNRVVNRALDELRLIIPRLDLDKCLRDHELRATLQGVPDRLMATLSENLASSRTAKHAAFALAAAMYPHRHVLAEDENSVRAELEEIFTRNNITSFFTLKAKNTTGLASVSVKVWNGVTFELGGKKPKLAKSSLFETKGNLEIVEIKGAKIAAVQTTAERELRDGQYAGLTAKFEPKSNSAIHGKIVIYFGIANQIYRRESFDSETLFPPTPKLSGEKQKRLRR